jgi:hypothetical protein
MGFCEDSHQNARRTQDILADYPEGIRCEVDASAAQPDFRGLLCPGVLMPLPTAAVFNLNHPAHTVHWHFFSMSVSNVAVIVLMLVVFAVAILAPFPRDRRTE